MTPGFRYSQALCSRLALDKFFRYTVLANRAMRANRLIWASAESSLASVTMTCWRSFGLDSFFFNAAVVVTKTPQPETCNATTAKTASIARGRRGWGEVGIDLTLGCRVERVLAPNISTFTHTQSPTRYLLFPDQKPFRFCGQMRKSVKFVILQMWKISRKSANASESPTPPTRAVFSSSRGFFDPDPCIHMAGSRDERMTPRYAPNRCIPAWRVVWSDQSNPAAQ